MERIFQVFQQLHGRHEYGGQGVGLAICRTVIESLGGTLRAENRPEGGVQLCITIPVLQGKTLGLNTG